MADFTSLRGVGKVTGEKLKEAGFETIAELANATPEELKLKTGISIRQAGRIIGSAAEVSEEASSETEDLFADEEAEAEVELAEDDSCCDEDDPCCDEEIGLVDIFRACRKVAKKKFSKKNYRKYKKAEHKFLKVVKKLDR